MAITRIAITHGESAADMGGILGKASDNPKAEAVAMQDYFAALSGGVREASVAVSVCEADGVAASGTITIDNSKLAADDVVTVAGVDFTCKASGATGAQFNKGASATASATNLKNAINANVTAKALVVASSALGVVTITALEKSLLGNFVTLAKTEGTGGAITLSGATLADGAGMTYKTYSFGK